MKEYKITIRQNLIDCGCDEKTIECFLQCADTPCKLAFLEAQRQLLLNKVHEEYAKVDCLDYLIEKIKRS